MSKENFMEELRNKLMSDKFKEWLDDTSIKATLYKLVDEKDRLQQENQQLKEELQKANDTLDTHNELIRYQKSVLDEIREYIENDQSFIYGEREPNGEFVWKDTANKEDMIAILDKVKE